MPPSRLDKLYRRMLITKFFEKGWGKPENLQRLFEFRKLISNRDTCYKLIPPDYHVEIIKEEKTSDCRIVEGKFISPLEMYLPGLVPRPVRDAHFQMVLPLKWADESERPMCIHFAGTGDHYYWRRRNFMAKPLIKEAGIGAVLMENPFYGVRKPKDQVRSNLHTVSDIFVMGGCLTLECMVLLHWLERNGYGPLGVTGLSMGGHMASIAATNWPKPLALVPCLSWSTASSVFTQGVMSQSIPWDFLETQFFSDGQYYERLAKMVTVVDDAFMAGKNFIENFNQSMSALQNDITAIDELARFGDGTDQQNTTASKPKQSIILHINSNENTLNLSADLLAKLRSKAKIELTQDEITELNAKIQIAQKQMQPKNDTQQILDSSSDNKMMTVQPNTSTSYVQNAGSAISSAIAGTTKLMQQLLPAVSSPTTKPPQTQERGKIDITKINWWEREALQFMRGMMDECTHLKNFTVPSDTSLIIAVCAKDDAYVPRDGCSSLEEIWPGAEVRYLDAGHVSAYVLHHKLFRSSIIEAFRRAKVKWAPNQQATAELPSFTYSDMLNRYLAQKEILQMKKS